MMVFDFDILLWGLVSTPGEWHQMHTLFLQCHHNQRKIFLIFWLFLLRACLHPDYWFTWFHWEPMTLEAAQYFCRGFWLWGGLGFFCSIRRTAWTKTFWFYISYKLTNPFSATYVGNPLTRHQWSAGGDL